MAVSLCCMARADVCAGGMKVMFYPCFFFLHLSQNQNSGKEQWNVTSVNATIPVKNNADLPAPPDSVGKLNSSIRFFSATMQIAKNTMSFIGFFFCRVRVSWLC